MERDRVVRAAVSSYLAVSLIVVLTWGAGCGGEREVNSSLSEGGSSRPVEETCSVSLGNEWLLEAPQVVERTLPGVVGLTIRTSKNNGGGGNTGNGGSNTPNPSCPSFKPEPMGGGESVGIGSGVIIDKQGTIVTNQHVVEGAETIETHLHDGRTYSAQIVGSDARSDIALLELEASVTDLQPLSFGNSEELRLGQAVIAIGNPFGLSGSVTFGVVSGLGRADVGLVDYEDYIQTDAAINPGNSGGALVDLSGRLVGINTAVLSANGGYQGVSFAIPANMAEGIIEELREEGKVRRGWLGIKIQPLKPELAGAFGLERQVEGIVVKRVHSESPAARAGIRHGDVILTIGGETVGSLSGLRNILGSTDPGDPTKIVFVRDGLEQSATVTLASEPKRQWPQIEMQSRELVEGALLATLGDQIRDTFKIPQSTERGVVVLSVENESSAAGAGLRAGDVIVEANRQKIYDVRQLAQALQKAEGRVLLYLVRPKGSTYVVIDY